MERTLDTVCNCAAYSWPHRRASGLCLWNPANDDTRCEECGTVCRVVEGRLDAEQGGGWFVNSSCCSTHVVQGGERLQANTELS